MRRNDIVYLQYDAENALFVPYGRIWKKADIPNHFLVLIMHGVETVHKDHIRVVPNYRGYEDTVASGLSASKIEFLDRKFGYPWPEKYYKQQTMRMPSLLQMKKDCARYHPEIFRKNRKEQNNA